MLSMYLKTLDFASAKPSAEYIGTKIDNPAMVLEENTAKWTRNATLEDIQVNTMFSKQCTIKSVC